MAAYSSHTDHELIALLKQDDLVAFTEIYNRYWDKLLAVAVNRLFIEVEAEECVQDVFLSLWHRRETITLKYSLSTYLWVAVKYQVINRLSSRNAKKYLKTTELRDEFIVGSADEALLEKELIERIEHSVQELPEKCRMVYRLSREEGKSNKEIARELNISEKTVEGHMTRAIKDIRTNLSSVAPLFVICHVIGEITEKINS